MRMMLALLGLALAVASGFAIHLWREAEAGRKQIAELQARLQQRGTSPVAYTHSEVEVAATGMAATVQAAPSSAATSPAEPPAHEARTASQSGFDAFMALQSSPEDTARRMLSARVEMEQSHPDLGEALGLGQEEARKLIDLLATHRENSSAVFRKARETGDNSPVSLALQEQRRSDDEQLQAMLGSKYPQWQDYLETRTAWQQRRDLRAVLDAAGTPMNDSQSSALIGALTAEHRRIAQEMRDATARGASPVEAMARNSPERNQRLLNAAAPHLTPQQLDAYRGLLDRAAAREQAILGPLQQSAQQAGEAASR